MQVSIHCSVKKSNISKIFCWPSSLSFSSINYIADRHHSPPSNPQCGQNIYIFSEDIWIQTYFLYKSFFFTAVSIQLMWISSWDIWIGCHWWLVFFLKSKKDFSWPENDTKHSYFCLVPISAGFTTRNSRKIYHDSCKV